MITDLRHSGFDDGSLQIRSLGDCQGTFVNSNESLVIVKAIVQRKIKDKWLVELILADSSLAIPTSIWRSQPMNLIAGSIILIRDYQFQLQLLCDSRTTLIIVFHPLRDIEFFNTVYNLTKEPVSNFGIGLKYPNLHTQLYKLLKWIIRNELILLMKRYPHDIIITINMMRLLSP
jgi:hypothetical protein